MPLSYISKSQNIKIVIFGDASSSLTKEIEYLEGTIFTDRKVLILILAAFLFIICLKKNISKLRVDKNS
jgi:amino acid permease